MLSGYEDKMFRVPENKKKWAIIASGPSLTKEDVDRVKSLNVIVINDNYKLAPWADILYACDPQWWDWHDGVDFKGKKYTQDKESADKYGLNYIEGVNEYGLSESPKKIHTGSNSGIQAINLAYHLGAREIILLGYDQQATGGKSHWFGDHPNGVVSNWSKWTGLYADVAKHAEELGLKIINCTRETSLTCFTRKSLEDVL